MAGRPEITPERWARIEALFSELHPLNEAQREAGLEAACAEDDALRRMLARLLAAHDRTDGFLDAFDTLRAAALVEGDEETSDTEVIGPYRIVREVGRGGMGAVYLAERIDGQFEQRVALKLIKRGMDSEAILRRFLHERQILARLQHPHVARLYDGGVAGDGRPFFAMEYVSGMPITRFCDDRKLDVEARLRIFLDACGAVQYAHQNLVVHRDLKPSNMVVTVDGELKLLDFGIAKLLDESEEGATQTTEGASIMTPEYAAPEQVLGGPITTATDVYALGIILFELLTGHLPYRLDSRTPDALARLFSSLEPERPSTAVGRIEEIRHSNGTSTAITPENVGRERSMTPERLKRRISGDLDMIVLTALRREPERRYPSAEALLEDVKRHLAGLPVRAQGESVWYRASKFVRRHALAVGATAAFITLLSASLVMLLFQQAETARARDRAEEVKDFLLSLFEVSDPNTAQGETLTARELLEQGARRVDTELAGQPAIRAEMTALIGDVYRQLGLYDESFAALEKALDLQRTLLGSGSRELAPTLNGMGLVSFARRDLDQAERFYREALAISRKHVGPDHEEIAGTLANLGSLYRERGRSDESARYYAESLEMRRRLYGDDNPRLSADLVTLGTVQFDRGEYDDAEAQFRQALSIRRTALGDRHTDVIEALALLSTTLLTRGDYDEAEATAREALELHRLLLGDEHPQLVERLHSLAAILNNKAAYEEAVSLLQEALELQKRTLGEEHGAAIRTKLTLAATLYNLERYEEAVQHTQEALRAQQATLGNEHPNVAISTLYLATMHLAEREFGEAERLFIHARSLAGRVFPEEHPLVADIHYHYGRLLFEQRRLPNAEASLREALRLQLALFGADTPWTAMSRVALGRCLTALGQYDEAETHLQSGLTLLEREYGAGHKDAREARAGMEELLAARQAS